MLKHKGTITIETERLILRRFTLQDAENMYKNWAADPLVTKYLSWKPHKDVDESRETIDNFWVKNYPSVEKYEWAIELKEIGEAIGSIALMNIDNVNDSGEVGYCIGKNYWNKGITTEAFLAIIRFGFSEVGFQRIVGRHHVNNPASGEVMKKCGLQYEGTLRKVSRNNLGELVDCKIYSILKEEYGGK